uniref:NADH dehydrogenase subunit 6 n=1 Tax=Glycera cf. tridactyla FS20 TaxID=1763830 RepID=A0A0S3CR16_9ANNE|nr:NADH dehydrogenase subunit 6 [Glycera cf. tridactyla FS20]
MMTSLFLMLTLAMGMSIILTFSPLAMGFWVLMIALLTASCTALSMSSWFGFIIFLIYIGGMLVMFAYFTAIQPNQQFKILTPLLATIITSFIMPIYLNPSLINNINLKNWWVTTMYDTMNIPSLIFLALALFLALISVVKISFLNRAPLRPFMYV